MKLAASIPLLALACGSNPPAPPVTPTPPSPVPPPTVLVVSQEDGTVRFFDVTARAVNQTREVKLPLGPGPVQWTRGGDPVVLLQLPLGGGDPALQKHDGEVGVIRKDGYHAFPAIPESTWGPPGVDHDPSLDLVVTPNDEIWAGRCEWTAGAKSCTDWIYARVEPQPLIATKVPPVRAPTPKPAKGPAWAGQHVELIADPSKDDPARQYLRCTIGGGVTEFPSKEQRAGGYSGVSDLNWIRAQPPTYSVRMVVGQDVHDGQVVRISGPVFFEGCTRTGAPPLTFTLAGPPGFSVLYSVTTAEILHEGRMVGTIQANGDGGVIRLHWAPQR